MCQKLWFLGGSKMPSMWHKIGLTGAVREVSHSAKPIQPFRIFRVQNHHETVAVRNGPSRAVSTQQCQCSAVSFRHPVRDVAYPAGSAGCSLGVAEGTPSSVKKSVVSGMAFGTFPSLAPLDRERICGGKGQLCERRTVGGGWEEIEQCWRSKSRTLEEVEEEQLEAILSAAVQTGSLQLLTGCIKHWTSEKQPNSAANLQFIRDCAWKKVVYTKDEFDHICVPLFDGSCRFLDPQKLQSLQHCQYLLNNLSRVLSCFQREPQELTDKDVRNQQVLANNFSMYAQMVLWFCQSGLLPEGSDGTMHLSTPSYQYPLLQTHYTGERQRLQHLSRGKCNSDCLMIDGIVSYVGDQLEKLWKKEKGGTGKYPPSSLHALLDLYLLESIEEPYKHAIVSFLVILNAPPVYAHKCS
ncbi:protein ELYS-like [Cuculus canorus]|uniref:protein ELYS-like n=1 Tax=Cuculus canorus TaxID=55661 RepID=UPI0023AA22D1|nr:protein ELYS-like [Cuculus canorus]